MLTNPAAGLLLRFSTALLAVSLLVRLLPMSTASAVVDDMAIVVCLALVVAASIYARATPASPERERTARKSNVETQKKG